MKPPHPSLLTPPTPIRQTEIELNDIRFSLRTLLKQPAFSLIAVLTLALGIGATSAVFSLIQGVPLTPPPYRQLERLVLIPAARADGRATAHSPGWAALQWMEWQKQAKSLDGIAAYAWTFNFLIRNDGSESIEGMLVTRDYFRVTGLQPLLGRTFVESESKSTSPPVIILGYDLWQRKFNGDPNIVGKTVRISRQETPPTVPSPNSPTDFSDESKLSRCEEMDGFSTRAAAVHRSSHAPFPNK